VPFLLLFFAPPPYGQGKGWKVGLESRHRQLQGVLRASGSSSSSSSSSKLPVTAELSRAQPDPVLFRF
jgi:hypothetical protein